MRDKIIIALTAALCFIPFLGGVHLFEWDEINFAEIAREMIVRGDFLQPHINFLPFTEKPPLFFWLQAISMKLFGIGEFAARFPNAVAGIAVLLTLFYLGKQLRNSLFAWLWVGAFFGGILPHLYFKSGIIDPWFNYFTFVGLWFLFRHSQTATAKLWSKYLALAALFTGLAILTKGPVALLVTGLVVVCHWIITRFKNGLSFWAMTAYSLGAIVVFASWLALETGLNGPEFLVEFTIRQWELLTREDAGHGGFLGYHVVVLSLGCFPMSVFALRGLKKDVADKANLLSKFRLWMVVLFWVVLVLFSLVSTKIVHYSSLAYYPMSFLAAMAAEQLINQKIKLGIYFKTLLVSITLLASVLVFTVPQLGLRPQLMQELLKNDPFAVANLNANVIWTGFEGLTAAFLIFGSFYFLFELKKGRGKRAFAALYISTALFVQFTLVFFIAKIEGYSQGALIRFYKSKADCENCYVMSEGFKSYGMYFYTNAQPQTIDVSSKSNLLQNPQPVNLYISSKLKRDTKLKNDPNIKFLGEENGYTFWFKPAENSTKPRQD